MTTTKTRKIEPSSPPTLDGVARQKMRAHISTYRALLKRQAKGDTLTMEDLSTVTDTLEALGLPDWVWPRDLEALGHHAAVRAKFQAAADAEPANRDKAAALTKEVESLRVTLEAKREELRRAQAGSNKSIAYAHTLAQLATEHPHVLADEEAAVQLRLDELNRRKREGVS